ncbi:SA1362 family protein [Staphylococcus massiliensis]|uniref:SA1362 family protein n=1 Tax=Staphylococcus massiliensis TaxID=555791 RepID=UPI0004749880|nr:SA1362 family protein [Staphylococcus massiliensis]POA02045.1 hypothetical protein CD133_00145 [Staphylococcus massiliensis CCUG 55927]
MGQKIFFWFIVIVALIGIVLNFNMFMDSFIRMIISLLILVGIGYLIYHFFFLTEDQRKYRRALRKNKRRRRK